MSELSKQPAKDISEKALPAGSAFSLPIARRGLAQYRARCAPFPAPLARPRNPASLKLEKRLALIEIEHGSDRLGTPNQINFIVAGNWFRNVYRHGWQLRLKQRGYKPLAGMVDSSVGKQRANQKHNSKSDVPQLDCGKCT
jgi:hypothetical protein